MMTRFSGASFEAPDDRHLTPPTSLPEGCRLTARRPAAHYFRPKVSTYLAASRPHRKALRDDFGHAGRGKDHPHVAWGYNNLASLLQAQGKYDEAEPLYRRAIEIIEKEALGKDDPDIAVWDNKLQAQGKYDEAEPLYRRAIEIRENVLGKAERQSSR